MIVIPRYPPDADCRLEIRIGGELWGVRSCLFLKPESGGHEVLATGPSHLIVDEARHLVGVDPVLMVAIAEMSKPTSA